MTEKHHNIVALNGGKRSETPVAESAKLIVEGEEIDLSSFILSGETQSGKRVILTWQSSLDQLLSYSKTLDIVVTEKFKNTMNE